MQKERPKEGSTRRRSNSRSIPVPGLRAARQKRALTQRELAAAAGTGAGTISDLETGRRGGYPKTIRRIADSLEISVVDLVE